MYDNDNDNDNEITLFGHIKNNEISIVVELDINVLWTASLQ